MARSAVRPPEPDTLQISHRSRPSLISDLLRSKKAVISLGMLTAVVMVAVLAPVLSPFDPSKVQTGPFFAPPSSLHPLGADNLGRDVLSRIIWGSRVSLLAGLLVSSGALLLGVPLGLLAGYLGRSADTVIMRGMDVLFAFPPVVMALTFAAVIGLGTRTVLLALVLVYTPSVSRVTRSAVLGVRAQAYIEAARTLGQRDRWIVLRHILPNSLGPVIVQATLIMSYAILSEAAISYLGLGTQSPEFSWGLMLSDASDYMWMAPYLALWPGLAIMLVVCTFNFLGDGLRDILDPRQRSVLRGE